MTMTLKDSHKLCYSEVVIACFFMESSSCWSIHIYKGNITKFSFNSNCKVEYPFWHLRIILEIKNYSSCFHCLIFLELCNVYFGLLIQLGNFHLIFWIVTISILYFFRYADHYAKLKKGSTFQLPNLKIIFVFLFHLLNCL